MRLVLASASPARLATLRAAGLDPEVVVSGVDESGMRAETPAALALRLAELKCAAVAAGVAAGAAAGAAVVGCDSVLELEGEAHGRPADAAEAVARWRRMRGRSGVLHTGHSVRVVEGAGQRHVSAVASTVVRFADIDDAEIDAYVATGEPLHVAGAFTLDGLGSAYVRGVDGDPHNVVGISPHLLRELLAELGIAWREVRRAWPPPPPG